MKKHLFITFGLLLLISTAYCQQVSNISAQYDDKSGLIIISYDLLSYSGKEEKYQIRAFYSTDNGETFIPINEAKEDYGDGISSGTGKKIRWDYFIENPDFTGKDVLFKVEAKWDKSYEINRLRKLAGPESALNSFIIPGWGHRKVTGEKGYWWTSAVVYGITGAGVYMAISANDKYKQYKSAQDGSSASSFLNKAKQEGELALILLGSGVSLWASNMIWVALRGASNRRRLNNLLSASSISPILLGYNSPNQTIGLQLKFTF